MNNILDVDIFYQTLHKQGLNVSIDQKKQFELFYKLLFEWNKKINLISRGEKNIVERHFLNSALISKFVVFVPDDKILDIGSGGGFPALILKILFPDSQFVLIESIRKKTDFLNCVINELKLKKIEIINSRAEKISPLDNYKNSFNYVTARAVASLSELFFLSSPFLKKSGQMLFLKGRNYVNEVSEFNRNQEMISVCRLDKIDQSQDGVLLIVSPK